MQPLLEYLTVSHGGLLRSGSFLTSESVVFYDKLRNKSQMLRPTPAGALPLSVLELTHEDTGGMGILTFGLLVQRTNTF